MSKNYRLIVRKSAGSADPSNSWVNTYEFEGPDDINDDAFQPFVNNVVDLEKTFHLADVYFLEALVTVVLPKGVTRGPGQFKSFALGGTGSVSLAEGGDDNLPINNVLVVQRQAEYGRKGELRYRRALSGASWKDSGGKATLNDIARADIQEYFNAFFAKTDNLPMVLLNEGADEIEVGRPVNAMNVLGIRGRQVKNNARPKIPTTNSALEDRLAQALILAGEVVAGIALLEAGGLLLASPALGNAATKLGGMAGTMINKLTPGP